MNFDRAARHQACGYNHYLLRAPVGAWSSCDSCGSCCARFRTTRFAAAMLFTPRSAPSSEGATRVLASPGSFDAAARHQACGRNRYLLRAPSLKRGRLVYCLVHEVRCSRIRRRAHYLLNASRDARTAHDSQFGLEITVKTKLTTKTATSDRTPQSSGDQQNVVPHFLVNMQVELLSPLSFLVP